MSYNRAHHRAPSSALRVSLSTLFTCGARVYSGVCSPFPNGRELLEAVTMSHSPSNPRAEHKVGGQLKNADNFQVPKALRPHNQSEQVKISVRLHSGQLSRGEAACSDHQRLRASRL